MSKALFLSWRRSSAPTAPSDTPTLSPPREPSAAVSPAEPYALAPTAPATAWSASALACSTRARRARSSSRVRSFSLTIDSRVPTRSAPPSPRRLGDAVRPGDPGPPAALLPVVAPSTEAATAAVCAAEGCPSLPPPGAARTPLLRTRVTPGTASGRCDAPRADPGLAAPPPLPTCCLSSCSCCWSFCSRASRCASSTSSEEILSAFDTSAAARAFATGASPDGVVEDVQSFLMRVS